MADSITFYHNPMSRGQIVRWMLEEVGVDYQVVILNAVGMKSPDYLAINPMGKVPAICAYLADAFPSANLAPALDDRSAYYRWLFFAAGPVEAAVTNRALGFEIPEGRESMAGYGNFERAIATLEHSVSGTGWICGDQFTAADIYVGSQVDFGLAFQSIPATPTLEAYAARLRARLAYQRQKALDAALIEEMQQPG